jgi:fibronectin-binding autotransporter adhesin
MKRIAIAACVAAAAAATAVSATASASPAGTLCVGRAHGCYATIQPAVDAAHDGDTILIAPGTYPGGITVPLSVTIVGAGAGSTIIKGGGPVLTLGIAGGASEPTISLAGVTVTGGVTTGDGNVTFVGTGGGVRIPGSATGIGATVTIRSSVITGNRASGSTTVDGNEPCPGGGACPFAAGFGGGIADIGRLTLINTIVSNNIAGDGLASSAAGGGIWTATNGGAGALTLINSSVTGNSAIASAPNGQFAEGGGIQVQDGEAFTLTNSVVSSNTASVSSSYPSGVEVNATTGGIHIGGSGSATIQGSRISGNVASASSPGAPEANTAALGVGFGECVCGQTLVLKDSVISRNRTIAVGGDGSFAANVLEIDTPATISNTAIIHNSVAVTSQTGAAFAAGAIFTFDAESQPVVFRNSVISGNTLRASTSTGPASVQGGALNNAGSLELHSVLVSSNRGNATGTSGSAAGGGIWNGQALGPDGPTPSLLLDRTTVIGNVLGASLGLPVQGGGVFTAGFPISLVNSLIAHNVPDNCVGC